MMRKNHANWRVAVLILGVVACALLLSGCTSLFGPEGLPLTEQPELNTMAKKVGCTIQDGIIQYSAGHYLGGEPLTVSYDPYGYNYQAHMFKGSIANAYLGKDGFPPYEGDAEAYLAENPGAESKWYWPYRDDELVMKWNDAWLSNKDCNGDGKLD
ncbi:MAG: hypothetical protein KAU10_08875, partial [Dehalococcoidia bacterium]|nr:hypothetical protein [Dehalococcoidia bacterium]